MPPAERAPKLLIAVSQDYGELSNALQLTRGTRLRATLLLPDKLLAANRAGLPVPASRYATAQDVIDAVAREQADLVCLFSVYLYAANNLFDLAALGALLGELRTRRVTVVTTDPFLGLMQQTGPLPFSARHPARDWLRTHFGAVARLLVAVPHLYHAPPDPAPAGSFGMCDLVDDLSVGSATDTLKGDAGTNLSEQGNRSSIGSGLVDRSFISSRSRSNLPAPAPVIDWQGKFCDQPAQPTGIRAGWLDSFVNELGQTAAELDPNGTIRIKV